MGVRAHSVLDSDERRRPSRGLSLLVLEAYQQWGGRLAAVEVTRAAHQLEKLFNLYKVAVLRGRGFTQCFERNAAIAAHDGGHRVQLDAPGVSCDALAASC